jgi:hypothetical protein
VGLGIPEGAICRLVINPDTNKPIDEKTLRAHFRSEIDAGQAKANAGVARYLYAQATGKGDDAGACVRAAIFWLKVRARWKETDRHEVTWRSVGDMTDDELDVAIVDAENAAGEAGATAELAPRRARPQGG